MIPPLEAMMGRFVGWKWLMSENVRCFVHKRKNTKISSNWLYSHFCTAEPSDWIWPLRGYGFIFLFWLTLIFVQFHSGHFSESTLRWVEQSWEPKPVYAVSVKVDIVAEKGCAIFSSLPRAKLTKTFFFFVHRVPQCFTLHELGPVWANNSDTLQKAYETPPDQPGV